jgi:hypothetical protein
MLDQEKLFITNTASLWNKNNRGTIALKDDVFLFTMSKNKPQCIEHVAVILQKAGNL